MSKIFFSNLEMVLKRTQGVRTIKVSTITNQVNYDDKRWKKNYVLNTLYIIFYKLDSSKVIVSSKVYELEVIFYFVKRNTHLT